MDIKDYISYECISFSLKATNKLEAINELSELLFAAHKITDLTLYIASVLKREEEYTTGIGDGLSIPHGKSSVVKSACIAYGVSEAGIEWNALDDKPVHNIFLLAIPESEEEEHLEMLSSLARKLMHQNIKDDLKTARDLETFYTTFK